jgi:rRNA maturation endonuclease Nob1
MPRYDLRALCDGCKVSLPSKFDKCPNCGAKTKLETVKRVGPFQDVPTGGRHAAR